MRRWRIWEDSERALNDLLDASGDTLSPEDVMLVREFIDHNEHEVAYSVLKDRLYEAQFVFDEKNAEIQERLEKRFYGKE